MDEFRVTFTIDLSIEIVYKYLIHDQINQGWDSTTIEYYTVAGAGSKVTQYFAMKFPFPLRARDYLWERFLVDNVDEKVVCCRSIVDNRFAPIKKSHSEGRVRAHLYFGGYHLTRAGESGEKTKIVYAANSDLQGVFALEFIGRRVAPTQAVHKVNELRKVAEVMIGPPPLPGVTHPLSYLWTTNEGVTLENPSERHQGTAATASAAGRLLAKNTSATAHRDRGPSAFDMFSGGFAKGRTQRAQTGFAEGFEVSENPMGLALKRGMMGGSSKNKSVGFAKALTKAAKSDVEMLTFARGTEKPVESKNTDSVGFSTISVEGGGRSEGKSELDSVMSTIEREGGTTSTKSGRGVWQVAFDKERGTPYYFNVKTNETTWIRPADFDDEE